MSNLVEATAVPASTDGSLAVSDGAYSDGQTATIQISGSIDDAQSGLTPGQKYYVQADGTLSETASDPSVLAGTAVASKLRNCSLRSICG